MRIKDSAWTGLWSVTAWTRKRCRSIIDKTDKYRGDFYRYHTGHEWADARNYDLCLNSGKLGFRKCVEEIKSIYPDPV